MSRSIALKKPNTDGIKKVFLGSNDKQGIIKTLVYYIILVGIGFIYVYPLLYMIVNSFMSSADLIDPAVTWLPTEFYLGNFEKAIKTLDFFPALGMSVYMSLVPALLQTIACAIVGYGIARFDFPLKKMWLALVVATFVIPAQVTLIPRHLMFYNYGFIGTVAPFFVSAILGQGLKSAMFILIFWTFFKSYPPAFDEAAQIDGAGRFKVFYKIAIPMAGPAIVLTMLFSFVWYWNETSQLSLYGDSKFQTLPIKLQNFAATYQNMYVQTTQNTLDRLNESISLAGTLMSSLPILLLYIVLQKQFVESIERSGITGE